MIKLRFFVFSLWSLSIFCGGIGAHKGNFLCKSCGETIASSDKLHFFASANSLKLWNQTLIGVKNVPVQLFKNPNGNIFNVVTFSSCNTLSSEEVYNDATWFEGFSWKFSVCPRCRKHLGWKYQPVNFNHVTHSEDDTFYGLVLDSLLEEASAETLLLVPNSYKS